MAIITDQSNTLVSAQESEERFNVFFNSISDAVFVHPFDISGLKPFMEVNNVACERYGYTREEFMKLSGMDITISSIAKKYSQKSSRERLLTEKHIAFEAVHVKKNGEKFPVEISSSIIHYRGEPYIISVVRDISERLKVQQETLEKQKIIESIYRVAPMGVGIVVGRVITHVNKGFCDLIQYDQKELVGKDTRKLYPSDEEYERVGREKLVKKDSKGIGSMETKMQRKDGEIIEAILRSTLLDPSDPSKGHVYTVSDITYLKKVQADLEKARIDAERSDRLKSAFIVKTDSLIFQFKGFS